MEEAFFFFQALGHIHLFSTMYFPASVVDMILKKELMAYLQLLGNAVLSLGPLTS